MVVFPQTIRFKSSSSDAPHPTVTGRRSGCRQSGERLTGTRMNSPAHGQDRLSGLAAAIAALDPVIVYGRVNAVRGLLVEVAGPIGAMSLGGRVGIEIAPGSRVPCEVIGFSGDRALVMPFKHALLTR